MIKFTFRLRYVLLSLLLLLLLLWYLRGPFEKFMDSPYYSESELCGGAVTVSFFEVTPVARDALLTILHPLLENVLQTVCRKFQEDSGTGGFDLFITSKFRNFFRTSNPQLVS
jgi:hypothetical protein